MLEKYLNQNSYVEVVLVDDVPEENISSGIPFLNDNNITILDLYKFVLFFNNSSSQGLLVKIKKLNIGYARADEIRCLFLDIKNTGKKVYIYLEDAGNIEYYVASSASKIFMPPWSTLNLIGLSFETYFIKDLLDSLDIEPEIDGLGEYKSAADIFKRNNMSQFHKEMMQTVLDEHFKNFSGVISTARNIPKNKINTLIDNNPLDSLSAKENNLIDKVLYENEVRDLIQKESDKKIIFVKYQKFIRNNKYSEILEEIKRYINGKKNYIGIININGIITQGESKKGSGYISTCGSDTACGLIKKAADDKSVTGVIVRVLSPGGSALASDLIRNEIENLSFKKPVLISMSDVAASGGYMVSLSSNKIHANPFTITGSIGIVAGKFNFRKLLNKYGINNETLQIGKMATIYSANKPFSMDEKRKFTQLIKDMYNQFVKLVSDKRKLTLSETERAAKGRVLISNDAKKLGLVNEIGILKKSVDEIMKISGWDKNENVYFKEFKAKNKLSLSSIGKLNGIEIINELNVIYNLLNKERLYAILLHGYKIH